MAATKREWFIRNIADVPWKEFPNHFGGALSKPLVMLETAGSQHLDYRISMYQPMAYVALHSHKVQEQVYHVLDGDDRLRAAAAVSHHVSLPSQPPLKACVPSFEKPNACTHVSWPPVKTVFAPSARLNRSTFASSPPQKTNFPVGSNRHACSGRSYGHCDAIYASFGSRPAGAVIGVLADY